MRLFEQHASDEIADSFDEQFVDGAPITSKHAQKAQRMSDRIRLLGDQLKQALSAVVKEILPG
eukprot:11611802-Alexandrium_andersonii.AAC.1